jgi:phospholipid/cholesterol/gamma-HCH transport system permease protein
VNPVNQITIETGCLIITGQLTHATIPELSQQVKKVGAQDIKTIDMAGVTKLDSAGVGFLDQLVVRQFPEAEFVNVSEAHQSALDTFSPKHHQLPQVQAAAGIFEKMGDSVYKLRHNLSELVLLVSEITYWSAIGVFTRAGRRRGAVFQQILLIGSNAVGIIALLSFVLGLILALQSAAQLRQFGASIYVADLIAISMVREMGPMMTAIIIAGRSGSAFAAEISSMKVSEEIDALRMMAVNPIRYVVVPKFLAITISMPLLVTLSMVLGIFGGFIIGVSYLNLTPVSYFNETLSILTLEDLMVGYSKSIFFAGVIVVIGSYYGFKAEGGAEGVGRVTTSAVVASIFAVIFLDAIFSLIYMV